MSSYRIYVEKRPQFRVEAKSLRDELNENLMYNRHKNWNSVSHIDMISQLEETFAVQFSTIEIMRFSTYEKGIEALEKFGVDFNK